MATTPTAVPQLLGTWAVDVDLDYTTGSGNFVPLNGITSLTPKFESTTEDVTDFNSNGWKLWGVTAQEWGLDVTVNRNKEVASRDAGQQALKAAAEGRYPIRVRWHEKLVGGDAYVGWAVVQWQPQGGQALSIQTINVSLLANSDRSTIANPYTATALPVINAISPATGPAAGGTLVKIMGSGFAAVAGATGVKFGTVNATTYTVHSDSVIYAVAPAQAASTKDVVVTNPNGVNVNTSADNYVYV